MDLENQRCYSLENDGKPLPDSTVSQFEKEVDFELRCDRLAKKNCFFSIVMQNELRQNRTYLSCEDQLARYANFGNGHASRVLHRMLPVVALYLQPQLNRPIELFQGPLVFRTKRTSLPGH